MQKKRIYILYVLCFVAGFLVPIIAPLSMREDEIILPADDTKYETEFLRAPSVALIDSININKLSCLCDNYTTFRLQIKVHLPKIQFLKLKKIYQ